eukprot:TRINITY_DN20380_c0_g1_i1.p1 TRINITY_DN20380_c0_g1~~TRINITY_DN20380_c0_g1_i1.p1  ORF type:complete len:498 (-),score=69.94 TRINITY_DN20380_c0_g1_i1:283-1776(-)
MATANSDDEFAPMPERFFVTGQQAEGAPKQRLLAFGDSLTAGFYNDGDDFSPYGSTLCQALAPAINTEVFVCGLSGWEASEMCERLDARSLNDCVGRRGQGLRRALREHGPFDLVLIMAGTNDLGSRQGAAATATAVKALHTACHCLGVRTVVLSVPPNASVTESARYKKHWTRVNALLREWSDGSGIQEGTVMFVDTAEMVPFSEDSRLWEEDGLHLSPAGSEHLGGELSKLLLPLLMKLPSMPRPNVVNHSGDMPICIARLGNVLPRRKVLCYGDSLTAGFHACGRLFTPYAENMGLVLQSEALELWVCGLSGLSAVQLAKRMDEEGIKDVVRRSGPGLRRLLERQFDLVLIMVGTNDLGKEDVPDIFAAIRTLHEACHRSGASTVILSVPPSKGTTTSAKICKAQRKVNSMLSEWAKDENTSQRLASFVDMDKLMPYDENSTLWEGDGLHFSREGSQWLGGQLAQRLQAILQTDDPQCKQGYQSQRQNSDSEDA